MNVRMIVPAVLTAVMLSTPVMAGAAPTIASGNKTPSTKYATALAEDCTRLEEQFDASIKTHENVAKVGEARALRTEGGKLCVRGQHLAGVAKLEQALKDLGVWH